MDVIVERPAALDVHNASVMACVRVPGDGRRRVEHVAEFQTTVRGSAGAARLAGGAPRRAGRDGGDRRVLEAGLGGARGSLRVPAGQRAPRQAGPGPQDRRQGRAMALPAARGRAAAGEPGAAEADPDAPQPDALSQEPDPRSPARDEPAAQGDAGHRDQARLRRHRHDGQVRARDARRARVRHHRPARARRSRARPAAQEAARRCERRSRAASTPSTRWSSGASSRTSTTSTRRSTTSRPRSRRSSVRSRRRSSCCARSPASGAAPPR